jgi:cystathionine gamma-synthase
MKTHASTQSVHAGREHPQPYHAIHTPIVESATFTFDSSADLRAYQEARLWGGSDRTQYGRFANPTVTACETALAALEHGEAAILFASGMAAITTTLLSMLSSGSHLLLGDDSYRHTRDFCLEFLPKFGIETSIVPMGDFAALETAIRPNTRLLLCESPTNPYLRVLDMERLVAVARQYRLKTLIDATFATPCNQNPLDFGIDLVIHSASKYLGGHNDLLAGVLIGSAELISARRPHLLLLGGIAAPHTASQVLRGVQTLAVRMERHNHNAQRIAEFLEGHPAIRRVWYPGLASHPDHAIAKAQMRGFGGVVSFEVAGSLEETERFVDALRIPLIAASLGGTETLVEQPALMSHFEFSSAERQAVGITDSLVRLAVGLEDVDDLIADLGQALDVIQLPAATT